MSPVRASPLSIESYRVHRIGILGAVGVALQAVIEPARRRSDIRIHGVASNCMAQARVYGAVHDIPRVYASYDELLSDPEIDLVNSGLAPSGACALVDRGDGGRQGCAMREARGDEGFGSGANGGNGCAHGATASRSISLSKPPGVLVSRSIEAKQSAGGDLSADERHVERIRIRSAIDKARSNCGRWRAHGLRMLPGARDAHADGRGADGGMGIGCHESAGRRPNVQCFFCFRIRRPRKDHGNDGTRTRAATGQESCHRGCEGACRSRWACCSSSELFDSRVD